MPQKLLLHHPRHQERWDRGCGPPSPGPCLPPSAWGRPLTRPLYLRARLYGFPSQTVKAGGSGQHVFSASLPPPLAHTLAALSLPGRPAGRTGGRAGGARGAGGVPVPVLCAAAAAAPGKMAARAGFQSVAPSGGTGASGGAGTAAALGPGGTPGPPVRMGPAPGQGLYRSPMPGAAYPVSGGRRRGARAGGGAERGYWE